MAVSNTHLIVGGCFVLVLGTAVYRFLDPPGFSRADPTGCYLVDGVPVFQLRGGRVLLPSGASAGVSYRVESSEVGNAVVTDHEIRLEHANGRPALSVGAAIDRWNSSVDRWSGPAMMMAYRDDELRPIFAFRNERCS